MTLVAATSHAQTNVILHEFGSLPEDGVLPDASLIRVGSKLFGTTSVSRQGLGAVFSINLDGSGYTILHLFSGDDGAGPQAKLTAVGGTLYGTTEEGGDEDDGVLFSINVDGSGFKVLHRFNRDLSKEACDCWEFTVVGSRLYTSTLYGGPQDFGSLISINLDGSDYRVLHRFNEYGNSPLVAIGKTLFGTTSQGGQFNQGTLFAIQSDGTRYRVLHHFTGTNTDGAAPWGGLTIVGSKLFGTTVMTLFSINPDGSGFTTERRFDNHTFFLGPLTFSGSTLFGFNYNSTEAPHGGVFSINPDGSGYRILHAFAGGGDGAHPNGAPVMTDSALYGTTYGGGIQVEGENNGTLFMLPLRTGIALKLKSDFRPAKLDTAILNAFIIVPAEFEFSGVPVTLHIAGAASSFVLDARGHGTNGISRILLSRPAAGKRQWQVSIRLKGDFDSIWQNAGLTNATVSGQSVTIPVQVSFEAAPTISISTNLVLSYRAKAGKSGTAR